MSNDGNDLRRRYETGVSAAPASAGLYVGTVTAFTSVDEVYIRVPRLMGQFIVKARSTVWVTAGEQVIVMMVEGRREDLVIIGSLAPDQTFDHGALTGLGDNDHPQYLLAAAYTAADVLAKILTVDGSGSGLDADTLDGHDTAYFLAASAYTAADVLAKILTVDGAGSGLDADTLDGHDTSYFQVAGSYQPLDTDLTAIAALTSAANKVPYSTGAGTWALADFTAAGRALMDDADAAAQLVTLGAQPSLPVGTIIMWGGAKTAASIPAGWLECDGSAVGRTGTYANLFAVIGTTYGTGDGSTTFNLPTGTGAVSLGITSTTNTRATSVTTTGASVTHTHNISSLTLGDTSADHTHNITSLSLGNQSANHSHNFSDYYNTGNEHTGKVTSSQNASHTHNLTSGATGNPSVTHNHTLNASSLNNASADHTHAATTIAITYLIKY